MMILRCVVVIIQGIDINIALFLLLATGRTGRTRYIPPRSRTHQAGLCF